MSSFFKVIVGPHAVVSCDTLYLLFMYQGGWAVLELTGTLYKKEKQLMHLINQLSQKDKRILESLDFWEFWVLSRWRNIRIQAPRIQNPVCFRHFSKLFKLPDPGANINVQSLLKFPTWGVQGRSKSPPHPVVPPPRA